MEVCAYLWESWYKSWDLWAQSCPQLHLSHIHTMMISENHWKHIKHSYLHLKTQSPLDQSVYIISYEVINTYTHTAATLEEEYCQGCGHSLTPWQKGLKSNWVALQKKPCSNWDYHTDIAKWTCQCGTQELNAYHLCKHLVQHVGAINPGFFSELH